MNLLASSDERGRRARNHRGKQIFNSGFRNDRLPYECTGFDWLPFCSNRFPMILRSPALDLAQEFLDSKSDAAMQKNRSILPEKINT